MLNTVSNFLNMRGSDRYKMGNKDFGAPCKIEMRLLPSGIFVGNHRIL